MDRSGQTEPVQSGDQQRLQGLAETFCEAWKHATSVDLARYLPPVGDPLRLSALHELIQRDLAFRWQRRQEIVLEDYLKRFPELGSIASLPVELIFVELRVRQLNDSLPDLSEYRRRFPAQFAELESRLRESHTEAQPFSARPATPRLPPATPEAATIAFLPAPPKAEVVNGFKLLKRIGSGSFAEVWQGESPGGFPVAIKRIIKELDDEQAQRELQSLEAIKQLRHPFLLQTQDSFILDNRLYVVMELADGTLRDRGKQCRKDAGKGIPLPELLCYFRESAEALDYMHKQHLLHRDIKPQNILLLNGHAKVADFGLARLHEAQGDLSATGSGTPAYMAPEVWRRKVSPHSDQYSLAFAYAEQRLGRWPFASRDMIGLMNDHLRVAPDLKGLEAAEQTVLRKALAKNTAERFPSCLAFVRALEEALQDELRDSPPSTHSRPPLSRLPASHPGTNRTEPDHDRRNPAVSNPSATAPMPHAVMLPTSSWRSGLIVLLLILVGAGALAVLYLGRRPAGADGQPVRPVVLLEPGPLTIGAGGVGRLSLRVKRHGYRGPVALEFVNLPAGCQTSGAAIAENQDGTELSVLVGPDVAPGDHAVTIRAAASGASQDVPWGLKVDRALYRLPAGWRKVAGHDLTEHDGKAYYDRIIVARGGIDVPFLLIPKKNGNDPPTFYVMEDKVWVALFRAFAAKPLRPLQSRAWEKFKVNAMDDQFPVMGVVAADAEQCAEWLGGRLPVPLQWDKAAGLFDYPDRPGPFEADFLQGDIAIGREAPMRRGAGKKDRSPFGCRDMAGNGLEWTSKKFETEGQDYVGQRTPNLAKLSPDDQIILRGWSYDPTKDRPLHYKDLKSLAGVGSTMVGTEKDNIGFRVVLELEQN